MDLHPWNQWSHDGQPEPGTDEILATRWDEWWFNNKEDSHWVDGHKRRA